MSTEVANVQTKAIVDFGVDETQIEALKSQTSKLTADTPEMYLAVKSGLQRWVKLRTSIDKVRQLQNREARDHIMTVNSRAKELIELGKEEEQRLKAERAKWENKELEEKKAREEALRIAREAEEKAERERQEAEMQAERERIAAERKAMEEARAAEQERLDRIKAEQDAENARIREELERQQAEVRAAQEAIEAEKQAERDRIEAEQRAEQERKDAELKAELDRQAEEALKLAEQQQAEKDRATIIANQEDLEFVKRFMYSFANIPVPETGKLKSDWGRRQIKNGLIVLQSAANQLQDAIDKQEEAFEGLNDGVER